MRSLSLISTTVRSANSSARRCSPVGLAGNLVLPARPETPRLLTGRFSSLAVRVSDHPLVQRLCRQYGKPLVSTSANLSGLEPCRSADEVTRQFGTAFPVLAGEVGGRLNPSEIRDALTGEQIRQG